MCPDICPHTNKCVLIFVLILIHVSSYLSSYKYVSSYYYMCPHITTYLSSYCQICVLIIPNMCVDASICVETCVCQRKGEAKRATSPGGGLGVVCVINAVKPLALSRYHYGSIKAPLRLY
jgi:hypothetical protein